MRTLAFWIGHVSVLVGVAALFGDSPTIGVGVILFGWSMVWLVKNLGDENFSHDRFQQIDKRLAAIEDLLTKISERSQRT